MDFFAVRYSTTVLHWSIIYLLTSKELILKPTVAYCIYIQVMFKMIS